VAPRPLVPEEVAALLRATESSIRAELTALAEDAASWHPAARPAEAGGGNTALAGASRAVAAHEWCVKECLGHLIAAELHGFAGRIRSILARPGLTLELWDPVAMAEQRQDCRKPVEALVEAFAAARLESLGLVESLRNVDLDKTGEHPRVGTLRVEDLLQEWVYHDRIHQRQLLANTQDYVWPALGTSRRFYE
jgi:hypothetical protein